MKKGAMELSISTIVIIVLAMSMLIFGLMLVRTVFEGGDEAITSINRAVVAETEKIFGDSNAKIAIVPTTRKVTLKQGSLGGGFSLSIKNIENREKTFSYEVFVDESFDSETRCAGFSKQEINDWLDLNSGSFSLGRGQKLDQPELISFTLPSDAPLCSIPFRIRVSSEGSSYATSSVSLIVEAAK
jgi:hypothetical protein